ncbi:MAG: Gfo/Idh/MocA family oxidoreductase [Treponema sp.]|nr:Gfo/Idh/MocA family oxidoreductase [Treponema sp.]
MRALLTGLGEWGVLWYRELSRRTDIVLAGASDKNEKTWDKIQDKGNCKFFTDAASAMDELKPDFVLNAAPPDAHRIINDLAFDRGISVLSEKPIAVNWDDVLHIVSRANAGQKLMIAENYRYSSRCRTIKEILSQNKPGNLTSIKIDFNRRHFMENYHKEMLNPILLDVGIHHLDMLRYFTGCEFKNIYTDFYTPAESWYKGFSNAVMCITMENDIKVLYNGRLDAHSNETDWYANWTFTGVNGILRYQNDSLYFDTGGQTEQITLPEDKNTSFNVILDEFTAYILRGTLPQTHISDNIKTQSIAQAAVNSFEKGKVIYVD